MMPLNEKQIRHHIDIKAFNQPLNFHLLDTIDSTNRFLKDLPPSKAITICCAEAQTQGRGRFGRVWHSPYGENIYFSARWRLEEEVSKLSGLSLVVSLAVLNTLCAEGIMIKWPNDLLWNQKKLSGCLIELLTTTKTETEVIIGIGINVNTKAIAPWCSLFDITGVLHDRNILIGQLIQNLNFHLQQLLTRGFSSFLTQWQNVDALKGQQITISQQERKLTGLAYGVNETGQLILVEANGDRHALSSGDTSLSLF